MLTNEPCIALNNEPPNTPATLLGYGMGKDALNVMFCLEHKHKIKVPLIPKGIPSEKLA